jgi:hypothetical protein
MGVKPIFGIPHNKLHVSVCRAMGLADTNQVGLDEMTATDGTPIDLTGPLDRLA